MSNFLYAWNSIENGCYGYFREALGTLDGVQAFTFEDMPRTMPDDSEQFFIWSFKIDGGGEVVQRSNRNNLEAGAWKMDAMFTARCSNDTVAKSVAGIIINALPVLGSDVDGLARLYHTAWPSRQYITVPVANENRAGDERRFVELIIPMACAFGNTMQ